MKSTQLHGAFIGHARQRHDLIGYSETRTVGAQSVESIRVWTFVIGVEHAVQSQQRRTMVHDTPIAALSSAGTGGS